MGIYARLGPVALVVESQKPERASGEAGNRGGLALKSFGGNMTKGKLGARSLILDDDEVIQLLRAAVALAGTQDVFAKRHGIDRSYLNLILNGNRPISEAVLKALGLRKIYAAE